MKKRGSIKSAYVTKADLTEAFDAFAIVMGRSFTALEKRLEDGINGLRFEFDPFKRDTEQSLYELKSDMIVVKEKLDTVDSRLGTLERRFDDLIPTVADHETRILRLETVK